MQIFKRKKHQVDAKKTEFTEGKIRDYAHLVMEDLLLEFETTIAGLDTKVAVNRLDVYGKNIISYGSKNTWVKRLIEAVVNPFNMILIVISIVTLFTDVLISDTPDYLTVSIIFGLVLVSSLIAFVQSERSNNAAEKLANMIHNKVDVIRDGQTIEVLLETVVVGDIIKLSAGDMIPADVRFIVTKDIFIAQSSLTGESHPVEKYAEIKMDSELSITDLTQIGFMGSNVVSGSAIAVVIATGNATYFGSLGKSLSTPKNKTTFQIGVDTMGKFLVRNMLLVIPIVFVINGLIKQEWLNAFLFSISIAVGLTPEMLPVIMTSTLAKGAVKMSHHKVIVKRLDAIQTLGQMDILCTDKTGTLTEDKIILEKYLDVQGNDSSRVLRHAALNSYFQTGLKNLIDVAIINRAENYNMHDIYPQYKRVDEIPFDFVRRRMSVVLIDNKGKRQLITKGAVEEMLEAVSLVEINGEVLAMNDTYKNIALATFEKYSNEGIRIIAVAQKNEVPNEHVFSVKDESNMVLIGFVGFLDPPKKSAAAAISALASHGIRTVVLTGDAEGVAQTVCEMVGIKSEVMNGLQVENLSDEALYEATQTVSIFAKLSPMQKERIIKAFQHNGHTVGYLGDGINDTLALRQADVGISVDGSADIAKETADLILLEKDLMVLEAGVIEGRRTFGNIMKYMKMATSGNFGNIISVLVASIFLPFLPMLPIHILTQNLLSDFAQLGIPFDNMDKSYLKNPKRWDMKSIKRFMFVLGIFSSIFDILIFVVLWYVFGANTIANQGLFHAGWFIFGTISQIMVIYVIRTSKSPIQSRPSLFLLIPSFIIILITALIGFTNIAIGLDMTPLPLAYMGWLVAILILYIGLSQVIKVFYIKKHNEWL